VKKRSKGVIVGALLVMVALLGFSFISPTNRYFEIARNLSIFASLFREVNEYYVDDINPSQLVNTGVKEMLAELDPYTVYISEDKIEDFRTSNTGQYAGIGASTIIIDGKTYIAMVFEGFSAAKGGLKIGDEIIEIDGTKIAGLSQERLNDLVKGQAKSQVALKVNRPGLPASISLSFEREKVTIPNVPHSGMLDENIGYIKFTEFTPNGYKNVKKALQGLLKDDAKGIVLDLRDNLGGLLKEAVDISNLFIDKDLEVVHTKGKVTSSNFTYTTGYNPLAPEIPLVVLINNMSASASEIVAGTLQDYDRAVLIGQKTFGKGLVQNTRDLPYNSKVKMTIAKYYIPSGRCIQALDYSSRNKDGSVGKIPDSLKITFKTRNGRTVYDGGGIDPEVVIETSHRSTLATQLAFQGYIFKYASKYVIAHNELVAAGKFNLSSEGYATFSEWVLAQNFSYTNRFNNSLSKLEEQTKDVKNIDNIKPYLEAFNKKLNAPLTVELALYSAEIKQMLEVEIASRYYLERGAIEASLGDDPYIAKALAILANKDKYKELLN